MRGSIITAINIMILCTGCIEELELFSDNEEVLVIEGGITDSTGPHTVRVYYSKGFNVVPEFVSDAHVKIIDEAGTIESLHYVDYGYYRTTEDFEGIPSTAYHLEVVLANGRQYKTIPDTLIPAPEITSLTYKLENNQVHFYISFPDSADFSNQYRWRYTGFYEAHAELSDQVCWTREPDDEYLHIQNDRFFDGRSVRDYPLLSIPVNRKFKYGYYLSVGQMAVSPSVYSYWKAVDTQLENTASIFETANYRIRGNVKNTEAPDELVLGVFQVSGISKTGLFIAGIPLNTQNASCQTIDPPNSCYTCLISPALSSTTKPSFWPK